MPTFGISNPFAAKHKDVPYTTVNDLKHLKLAFDIREEGKLKYKNFVYNKMKPNWLY